VPATPPPATLPGRIAGSVADFLRLEAASGILLFAAAVAAIALANSPGAALYDAFLHTPVEVRVGAFQIAKPLLLWINDGLMAVFFFLVGLELKREVLEGELSQPEQIVLPAIAAAAGMALPAAIYAAFNWGDAAALRGWAIPTATDIAFALGVLSLLGARVPSGLKVFLLTLAILDDLAAIVVIALFYTEKLSLASLVVAACVAAALGVLNRRRVTAVAPYLALGLVMWAAVLKSGVHATLAGVVLAFFVPLRVAGEGEPPLRRLERELHPTVAYAILPLFAFANAGVPLAGVTFAALAQGVPAGVALGLVAGKMAGVLGATWLAVKLGLARLPDGAGWLHMAGVAALCGIGFTMSLFIAGLAFEDDLARYAIDSRLGILCGSVVSGLAGYLLLRAAR
jgi:NhaA family Na+:H+ antiporter